jgi:putative transposase
MRLQALRTASASLRERMQAIAHEPCWLGYRRLQGLMGREGCEVNHKRFFRIYREDKLPVRGRGGCKWAMGTRLTILVPVAQRALVPRLRLRPVSGWPGLPSADHDCTCACLTLAAVDRSLSGSGLPANWKRSSPAVAHQR